MKQIFIFLLTFCAIIPSWSKTNAGSSFKVGDQLAVIEKVWEGKGVLWGFDFLPGGQKVLLTLRSGSMLQLNLANRKISVINGLPEIEESGQGGLMDIKLDPQFAQNQWVYFTYAAKSKEGVGTRLARAKLTETQLSELKVLFIANPAGSGGQHFGSRIVFGPNETLFFGIGDRGERKFAQDLKDPRGKIHRLFKDGKIPPDNPFFNSKKALASIWSLGHRNPQGLYAHPKTGALWEQEHGPRGGDEINLIVKGKNYGWPVITYGKEYWGPSIGPGAKEGYEQPVHYWVPSIAPGSLMIYSGKMFREWEHNFISGALKLTHLNRLVIKSNKVVKEERLLEDLHERIRHVVEAPNGEIFFSTDSGKLYRMSASKI